MIDKIEILRRAKVRRAKLYHIRDKAAKEISRQMRRIKDMRSKNLETETPEAAVDAEDNVTPTE
jgi:ribosomal protein L19